MSEQFDHQPRRRRRQGLHVIDGQRDASDRVLPCSEEAEGHVIACCLLDGGETIARCKQEGLTPAGFHIQRNRTIFGIIREINRIKPPVTIEVLAEELRTRRQLEVVGGLPYLLQLTANIPTVAHAGYFIEKVIEKWLLREVILRCTAAVEDAHNFTGGLREFLGDVNDNIGRMTRYIERMERKKMSVRAREIQQVALARMAGKVETHRRLTTGLPFLDKVMGPFDVLNGAEEWFIVIGASRSCGKSTLLRNIAVHNAGQKKRGVVFTLETGMQSWIQRAAGSLAEINDRHLDNLPIDMQRRYARSLEQVTEWIGKRLWVYEDVYTVDEMEAVVRELDAKIEAQEIATGAENPHGLDFIVIDYLQLVEMTSAPQKASREERLGLICRRLHTLCKTRNVPAFVSAQVNRSPVQEKRRPTLADFRESGAIENTADVVLALHTLPQNRAGIDQDEKSLHVEQELLVLKRRNGPTGYESVMFKKDIAKFVDMVQRGDARPGQPKPSGGYKREGGS